MDLEMQDFDFAQISPSDVPRVPEDESSNPRPAKSYNTQRCKRFATASASTQVVVLP